MKKYKFSKLLTVLTATLLLMALAISTLFGSTSAEYFRTLSKELEVKALPDLMWEYFVSDAASESATTHTSSSGVYEDTGNFNQSIVVGQETVAPNSNVYIGRNVIYQVKIPVTDTGYYNLDFAVDFAKSGLAEAGNEFAYKLQYQIGCEVVSVGDTINSSSGKAAFKGTSNLELDYRMNVGRPYTKVNLLSSERYQWKTLCPTRMEYVSLTFKVEDSDVNKGYVIWMWDFEGLRKGTYTLRFTGVGIEKFAELDGSPVTAEGNEPYFNFAKTSFVNNQILPDRANSANAEYTPRSFYKSGMSMYSGDKYSGTDTSIIGNGENGGTEYMAGRGTYPTSATANSLTAQVETLYFGYKKNANGTPNLNEPILGSSNTSIHDTSNPVAINIPLKNIKYDTTYKVFFDFSIARHGDDNYPTTEVLNTLYDKATENDRTYNYVDYDMSASNFFHAVDDTDTSGGKLHFESYLASGAHTEHGLLTHESSSSSAVRETNKGNFGRSQIVLNNVGFPYHEVTRYNELANKNQTGIPNTMKDVFASSVNSLKSVDETQLNWYNAVEHQENEGQWKINWLTFYNTSFSFNISEKLNKDRGVDLNDLYWTWAIDALKPNSWFRIKIENVRIEEVVQYGSKIATTGLKLGNEQIATGIFDDRSANGTGQNFQAMGYSSLYMAGIHTYGAIYDAQLHTMTKGDYSKIYLNGFAVCKGGINKYVWSADGGVTWYDMIYVHRAETLDILKAAENHVDQIAQGYGKAYLYKSYYSRTLSNPNNIEYGKHRFEESGKNTDRGFEYTEKVDMEKADFVDFTWDDAANSNFQEFGSLYADLKGTPHEHQADLNIIFAAIPEANLNARCEILRIMNYNPTQNYRTYTLEIESDIDVKVKATTGDTISTSDLNAVYNQDGDNGFNVAGKNNSDFTALYGLTHYNVISSTGGYSRGADHHKSYEDIRAIYQDIPIKKTLTIRGWSMVYTGASGYYWSADGGKTWNPCSGDTGSTTTGTSGKSQDLFGTADKKSSQRYDWYDGEYAKPTTENFMNTLYFDNEAAGQGITANLSAYAGQTIDVIFAAKSNAGGPFCPVARIDNVAVYGDYGSFFTEHHVIDVGEDGTIETRTDADGKAINGSEKWKNIKLGTTATGKSGYESNKIFVNCNFTIYEPYNSNYKHIRYAFNKVVKTPSAGPVYLEGFTAFKGNSKDYVSSTNEYLYKYKFSLDGGETWYDINQNVEVVKDATNHDLARSKYADASYDTVVDYNKTYSGKPALEFNIPPLPVGAVRELLVVVEGTGSGIRHPILRTKIQITAPQNNALGNYLVRYEGEGEDLTNIGVEKSGIITSGGGYSNAYMSLREPSSTDVFKNTGRLRFTLPVSRVGPYSLNFDFSLGYSSGSTGTTSLNADPYVASQIIRDNGVDSYAYSFGQIVTYHSGSAQGTQGLDLLDIVQIANPFGSNTVSHTVYATEEDLARGYVCWEIDLTQLAPTHDYQSSTSKGFKYDVSVSNVVWGVYASFAADNNGTATEKVRIPVSEAGSYNLNYSYTMYAHKGVEETSSGGAYFSVPKTVYTEGEEIAIDYYAKGGTFADNNNPWIAIVKTHSQKDYYVKWDYVEPEAKGTITLSSTKGGSAQDEVKERYGNLPAGNYKILFMNGCKADGITDPSKRLVPDPIFITILPKDAGVLFPSGVDPSATPVVRTSTNGAEISVEKTFFAVETISDEEGNMPITFKTGANVEPWLCISAGGWYFTWTTIQSGWGDPLDVRGLTGGAQSGYEEYRYIPPGQYKIHLMAKGASDITGTNLVTPIDIYIFLTNQKTGSVNKTVTVTDEDVAKGYIEIECSTEGWSSGENVYFHTASFNFEMTKN